MVFQSTHALSQSMASSKVLYYCIQVDFSGIYLHIFSDYFLLLLCTFYTNVFTFYSEQSG